MADGFSGLISNIGSSIKNNFVKSTPSTKSNFVRVSSSGPTTVRQSFSDTVKTRFGQGLTKFRQEKQNAQNLIKTKALDLAKTLDRDKTTPGFQLLNPGEKQFLKPIHRAVLQSTPISTPIRAYDTFTKLKDSYPQSVNQNKNSILSYAKSIPSRIANESYETVKSIVTHPQDVSRGFFGEYNAINPTNRPDIKKYEPQTRGQKIGSDILKLVETAVEGQNIGVNQSIEGGVQSISYSPEYQFFVNKIKDYGINKIDSFFQKVKPLNITFDDLRAVTTGKGTPDQLAKYAKFNELKDKGFSVQEILAMGKNQQAKTPIIDFLYNTVSSLFKKAPTEEAKLITSGLGDETFGPVTPQVVNEATGLLSKVKLPEFKFPESSSLLTYVDDTTGKSQQLLVSKADIPGWISYLNDKGIEYGLRDLGLEGGFARISKTPTPPLSEGTSPETIKETKLPEKKSEIIQAKYNYASKVLNDSQTVEEALFNIRSLVDDARFRGTATDFQAIKKALKEYKSAITTGPGLPRNPEYDALFTEIDNLLATKIKEFKLAPQEAEPVIDDSARIVTEEAPALGSTEVKPDEAPIDEVIKQGENAPTVSPDQAKAEAEALSPTGEVVDVAKSTDPLTEEFTREMNADAQAREAQRAQEPVEPQVDLRVDERIKGAEEKVFGKPTEETIIAEAEPPIQDTKLRKTYQSIMESDKYGSKYKEEYVAGRDDRFYDVKKNKESVDAAFKAIERDGESFIAQKILTQGINLNNPDEMAQAIVLHKILEDKGDFEAASSILGSIFDNATKAGQSAQMLALIDQMGPSGMVRAAKNFIEGGEYRETNGLFSKIFSMLGIKKGKYFNRVETNNEISSVLDEVRAKFPEMKTDSERVAFLSDLINRSKNISKNAKNKKDLVEDIVKLYKTKNADQMFDEVRPDLSSALKEKLGIPTMDKEFSKYVFEEASKINKMESGEAKDKATRDLFQKINEKVPLSLSEVHRAMRYNNVLLGLGTHERNIYENLIKTIVYQPYLIGADELTSGHVVRAIAEPIKFYRDLFNNLSSGYDGFKKALRGENYPDKMVLDAERYRLLPTWLQFSTRLLQGEDEFFTKPLTASLEQYHLRSGLSPSEASRMAQIDADNLLYRGGYDPENKTGQGILLSNIDKAAIKVEELVRKIPFGDRFVMFPRIATKILKAGVEYSPFGYATMGGNSRAKIQAIKASTGLLAALSVFALAAEDKVRGAAPDDKAAKEAFYAEGPAWSIRMGDTWVPMKYFGPLSLSMKMSAHLYDLFNKNPNLVGEGLVTKAAIAILGASALMSDETYLTGVSQVFDAVNSAKEEGNPYALKTLIGQNLEQEIPLSGFFAWVNQAFIDKEKRSGGGDVFATMVRRQPILSQGVESYTTPDGEPATVGFGDPVLDIVNPFLPFPISKANEEYSDVVKDRLEIRMQNKQDKLEEEPAKKYDWDKVFGASAAETGGIAPITETNIKTADTTQSEPEQKSSWWSKIFGGKKETEKVYQPGEKVVESSNDRADVYALTDNETFTVPKDQDAFSTKYKEIAKKIENFNEDYAAIEFDDAKGKSKKERELKELQADFDSATLANSILEEKYPEQVFNAQLDTYKSGGGMDVVQRATWAASKLKLYEARGEQWQNYINKMWEESVFTNDVINELVDEFGYSKSDLKYTGDNERIAKKAKSATGVGGKKFSSAKIDLPSAPQFSKSDFQVIVPDLSRLTKIANQGSYLPVRASDYQPIERAKLKAPEIRMPELQTSRLKVKGL